MDWELYSAHLFSYVTHSSASSERADLIGVSLNFLIDGTSHNDTQIIRMQPPIAFADRLITPAFENLNGFNCECGGIEIAGGNVTHCHFRLV